MSLDPEMIILLDAGLTGDPITITRARAIELLRASFARRLAGGEYAKGWNDALGAAEFAFNDPLNWLCLDHGGEEQEEIVRRLRALKKGTST